MSRLSWQAVGIGMFCLLATTSHATVKVGAAAPILAGQVIGGSPTSLRGLRGKVVFVDFWATWCEPCRASLPKYEALQRKYGAKGLVILAISVDNDVSNVQRFIKKHGLTLQVIHDKGGKIAERFQPAKMPTAYLIGRDGRVAWVHGGFKAGDGPVVERQIVSALGRGVAGPTKKKQTSQAARQQQQRWIKRERGIMGTRFAIFAQVRGRTQTDAVDRALDHVDVLEKLWSPWISGSDLTKMNAARPHKPVKIAAKTAALLRRAVSLCRRSKGAFDPTFFSLHGLWRLKSRPFVPPTKAAIKARLADVGCANLVVSAKASTAWRTGKGTKIHLGGNAKGTALDEAAALLIRAGVHDFVVDGGGDLVTSGGGPKGPWRVGIKRPRAGKSQVAARLQLSHGEAVATSGDYERFVQYKGRRYHHILDPRTGSPVQGTHQVTVVAAAGPHAGEKADGLATAVFVLGPRDGLALIAQSPGVDALIIDAKGRWHFSPGMRSRLSGVTL